MTVFNFSTARDFCARFFSGDRSPAEHVAFVEWLAGASAAEVEALLEEFGEDLIMAGAPAEADPALVAAIEARLDEAEFSGGADKRKKTIYRRLVRIGVAAALLLAAAGVGWWIGRSGVRQRERVVENNEVRQDFEPGGDKAVLTLSDGSRIVLDTAANGQLARQGGTSVVKEGGQVSYSGHGGKGDITYNSISTPRGGQFRLVLADGTVAWLNSASSLRFPTAFEGAVREVELTGEGFFEVVGDKNRPFRVRTGDQLVTVLGTELDIMAYPEEPAARTTLVTGSVRVERGRDAVVLDPGRQAVLYPNRIETDVADVETTLAWKNGRFEFDETDIRSIMRQIERWYDVKINFQGNLEGVVLSGSISRRKTVAALLEVLAKTKRFHFTIENDLITIMP